MANMSKMLELMKQELEGCGVGTVYIDVPQLQVHPCIGCMKCRSSLKCCLPEDGHRRVLQSMKEVRCSDNRCPLLLGKHAGRSESAFRPYGLRYDGGELLGNAPSAS